MFHTTVSRLTKRNRTEFELEISLQNSFHVLSNERSFVNIEQNSDLLCAEVLGRVNEKNSNCLKNAQQKQSFISQLFFLLKSLTGEAGKHMKIATFTSDPLLAKLFPIFFLQQSPKTFFVCLFFSFSQLIDTNCSQKHFQFELNGETNNRLRFLNVCASWKLLKSLWIYCIHFPSVVLLLQLPAGWHE